MKQRFQKRHMLSQSGGNHRLLIIHRKENDRGQEKADQRRSQKLQEDFSGLLSGVLFPHGQARQKINNCRCGHHIRNIHAENQGSRNRQGEPGQIFAVPQRPLLQPDNQQKEHAGRAHQIMLSPKHQVAGKSTCTGCQNLSLPGKAELIQKQPGQPPAEHTFQNLDNSDGIQHSSCFQKISQKIVNQVERIADLGLAVQNIYTQAVIKLPEGEIPCFQFINHHEDHRHILVRGIYPDIPEHKDTVPIDIFMKNKKRTGKHQKCQNPDRVFLYPLSESCPTPPSPM